MSSNKYGYNEGGLTTVTNCDFLSDPLFYDSYELGISTLTRVGGKRNPNFFAYDRYRVYVICWAASQAKNLLGDFVECGVNTGFLSRAAMNYIGFENLPHKKFYLLDTFCGIPPEQISENEKTFGISDHNSIYDQDIYPEVKEIFKNFERCIIIQGKVPDTLSQLDSEAICYLSMDMNCAVPERAAMEYLWDKLVPGAIVVFDDYGFPGYINSKLTHDDFAESKGTSILTLPTGQGLLIKPVKLTKVKYFVS
jgi:hypothetical protein